MVNFKAYNNYNSRTLFLVFLFTIKIDFLNNGNSGFKSTLEPNTSACNQFIATAVKKENAYIMAAEDNKR